MAAPRSRLLGDPDTRAAAAPHRPGAGPRDKAVRKYLERHAEPEARRSAPTEAPYRHVVCVPAYAEHESLGRMLDSVPPGPLGTVLMIVVVNQPEDAPDWAAASNRETLALLRDQLGPPIAKGEQATWFAHPRGTLLLVDRASQPLPAKQGVGLARKIAADIALRLWSEGSLVTPFIHCTDADVILPPDYFARRPAKPDPAALAYDFIHDPSEEDPGGAAILRYELSLRYYVLGLRSAGSPYAHHSIGSTIAVAPAAYAQVRGFPRRAAGEDFHLLAKLAKVGPIAAARGVPIRLSGRVSQRAPFGTGTQVARTLERMREGEPSLTEDPRIFEWLGAWLRGLARAGVESQTAGGAPVDLRACVLAAANESRTIDGASLLAALDRVGALRTAEADVPRGPRQAHERFDALRTRQWIHHLRDHHFPSVRLDAALERAPFIALPARWDLSSARDHLAALEAESGW